MRARTVLFAAVLVAGLALVAAAVRPLPPGAASPAADNPCQLIAGPARAWCDHSRSTEGEGAR
ncbi:hypothetical protein [Streptomyces violascens]|uniref:hypothetical protein n=1 Tax=Streptomyces violascens TaxID=67381 RepID=UPI0036885A84